MTSDKEMFPYAYIFHGERNILIWQSGDGKDNFRLDSDGILINAKDNQCLKKWLGKDYVKVHWDESNEIDFDKFWIALRNLKVGRASSRKTCKLLLDGWNFIEDLLTTFDMIEEKQLLKSASLNRSYKKLFHGVNLPSVTPNHKSYLPLWEDAEILTLRKEMRIVWNSLCEAGYVIDKKKQKSGDKRR